MKNLFKDYIYPIATLTGSIVGVGFFALPFVTLKAGIWAVLFYFLILGGIVLFIHLIFSEICLKTPDRKRFPGFAEFHLGKWGQVSAFVISIIGSLGVLLAYLIIGGEFLSGILLPIFGGSVSAYTFLFFVVLAVLIYFGINIVSKVELCALIFLLISMFLIFMKGFWNFEPANIFAGISSWKSLFLPYGAVMFSLWGTGLIPEVEEMLGKKKRQNLKKIVSISILTAASIYLLFIFLVLGITGANTTDSALIGLKDFFGGGAVLVVLSAGVFTTFSAFAVQGLLLKETFMCDLGIKNLPAWVFTCCTPMILFLLGFKSFIPLISLLGGVLLSASGILILLMYRKIGGRNIIIYPLSFVFLLGVIYEIVYFII